MIYLKTRDAETGREKEQLFFCWGDVHAALFSPDVERVGIFEFKTHGKTYGERRANLLSMAQDFQQTRKNAYSDLTGWECIKISEFFKKNGGRLGLVRELRKIGVI